MAFLDYLNKYTPQFNASAVLVQTNMVQQGQSVQTFTGLYIGFDLASYGSLESNYEQVKREKLGMHLSRLASKQAIFTRQITTLTRHWRPGEWLSGALIFMVNFLFSHHIIYSSAHLFSSFIFLISITHLYSSSFYYACWLSLCN